MHTYLNFLIINERGGRGTKGWWRVEKNTGPEYLGPQLEYGKKLSTKYENIVPFNERGETRLPEGVALPYIRV